MAIGNSVQDEIREQQKKVLESQGFKGRLEYFFHYYKWYTLVAVLVLLIGGSMIYDIATKKDCIMQAVYVNAFPNVESTAFMAEFEKTIEFNPKKEETSLIDDFYSDMEAYTYFDAQNLEKLLVLCAAETVDVCVVDDSYLMHMAEGGYFKDLSTIFTDEQMEEYKDKLVWYDCPDDITEGEAAIALEITDASKIVSTQSYPNSKCYFTVIINAPNVDNALAFLEYLETP